MSWKAFNNAQMCSLKGLLLSDKTGQYAFYKSCRWLSAQVPQSVF